MSISIAGRNFSSLHLAGIRGSGMSAIAQYLAWGGHEITGYGPTRFLKYELVETFDRLIRDADGVYFLPIYYAGGTVKKDISSEDSAEPVGERGVMAHAPQDRKELIVDLKKRGKPGDVVILMGARDPTLSRLVQEIRNSLSL